jgi:tetratricopeptide (TPR) repeat protein
MADDVVPTLRSGRTPGLAAWVASGILVETGLWEALTWTPNPGPLGYVFVAMTLCWTVLAILPGLIWLGRPPGWPDALRVLLAAPLVALVVVCCGAVGFAVGFAFMFLLGIPGILFGGASAAAITALAMQRLLAADALKVPVGSAAASGAGAAAVLALGMLDPGLEYNRGALVTLCAAVPALVVTGPWSPLRRSFWRGVGWVGGMLIAVLALVGAAFTLAAPYRFPLDANTAHCLAEPNPDCLANTAFHLQAAIPREPSKAGWASPPLSNKNARTLSRIAINLARSGHADQARQVAANLGGDASSLNSLRDQVAWEVAASAVIDEARAHPDRVADLSPFENEARRTAHKVLMEDTLRDTAKALEGLGESMRAGSLLRTGLPTDLQNLPTLRAIADLEFSLRPPLSPPNRAELAELYADLGDPARAKNLLPGAESQNCWGLEFHATLRLSGWRQALSMCRGFGEGSGAVLAAPAMRRNPAGAAEAIRAVFDDLIAPSPEFNRKAGVFAPWTRADQARKVVDAALDIGDLALAADMAGALANWASGLEGYSKTPADVRAAAAFIDVGENEKAAALLKAAAQPAKGPKNQNLDLIVQLDRLGIGPAPSDGPVLRREMDLACAERLAPAFPRERRDADCRRASPNAALELAYRAFNGGRPQDAQRILEEAVRRMPRRADIVMLERAGVLAHRLGARETAADTLIRMAPEPPADGRMSVGEITQMSAVAAFWHRELWDVSPEDVSAALSRLGTARTL